MSRCNKAKRVTQGFNDSRLRIEAHRRMAAMQENQRPAFASVRNFNPNAREFYARDPR